MKQKFHKGDLVRVKELTNIRLEDPFGVPLENAGSLGISVGDYFIIESATKSRLGNWRYGVKKRRSIIWIEEKYLSIILRYVKTSAGNLS